MKAYLINMHLLVPRSRSYAKVKVIYKGYISKKNGRFGGIRVSQTHLVFLLNRVISVISVVLRETTLTISDSTGEPMSMESEIMSGFR